MKKVLLIIIDALTARVVDPALEAGRLPNFAKLRDAASVQSESIAIFPSITPAATSSLITGRYPRQHGVSGAYWYVPEKKEVVYYGYDIWAVWEEGLGKFLNDFLIGLNEEHLRAETLFQTVENNDGIAASLNYLIYHGNHYHEIDLPLLLKILPGAEVHGDVKGPTIHYFGDLIRSSLNSGEELPAPGGLWNRYGFSDDTTVALLQGLIERGNLPDFTLAYFPENDFLSHEEGPEAALEHLETLDTQLGKIFDAYGGLDAFLTDVAVVLTGDHSQSNVVEDSEKCGIRLDQLLSDFAVAAAGTPMEDQDDMVICPNLCTAQLYFHSPTKERFDKVVDSLLPDERIDQILWGAGILDDDHKGYHVLTANRGHLHFWPGADGPNTAEDEFGGTWSWEGDLRTVDATVKRIDGIERITFGDYPNAFERIVGILDLEVSGHLWITSHPGYEFGLAHTELHPGGGSHGSLHRLDSISPFWVAGAPQEFSLPPRVRSVDVAPICASILGLPTPYQPGESRA